MSAREHQFVGHVPGFAMGDHDYGLGKMQFGFAEWVDCARICRHGRATFPEASRGRIHVDAAREIGTVTEQDRRAQARIMFVVVVGSGEAPGRFWVDSIVDIGPVDSKQNDRAAPLHGQLDTGTKRDIFDRGRFTLLLPFGR